MILSTIMMLSATVPAVSSFEDIDRFTVISVDKVGWPEDYPYAPGTIARVAHTEEALLIRFEVTGEDVRAICLEDNGHVWEDSCVEFFVQDTRDENYYFNFETNCIGSLLVSRRRSRDNFKHFDAAQLSRIVRRASFPHEAVEAKDASWSLELEIPFDIIGHGGCPDRLKANFYKCGARPHYLSWSPIDTPVPDFHCPQFFGELILER